MPSIDSTRPFFRAEDAVALARDLYGMEGLARPLPSERDQNFHLKAGSGESYVLKIARADERSEELDLQNSALAWLAERDAGLTVPRLVRSRSGASTERVAGANGSCHLVRMLTYLPGVPLWRVNPQTLPLLRSVGRFLGELDRALGAFSHPASADRDLEWDPKRAPAVIDRHKADIADGDRRALVERLLGQYETTVASVLPSLRKSVIHNDANDHNLLIGEPLEAERRVSGLVDFGDMVEAWTVCEPAVAIAYAMLGKPDPLAAAAAVVGGYHEALALTDTELEIVFTLACLRLCTSVCLSAHRRRVEPADDYLTVSEAAAWTTLQRLADVHPRLACYSFRQACGMTACPRTPALAAWLSEHRAEVGPVVDADLGRAIVLDLSVGSPELEETPESSDGRVLQEAILGVIRAARAEVAVGRYDEARLLYASDAYKSPSGEWRTVHLGVDLFLPPGAPVRAPLAGRVHSFRNNDARLDYGPTVILQHEPPNAPTFFTLYGHLTEDSLAALREGKLVGRGETIGRIGSPPANGDWPPHLHFQIVMDVLGSRGDFPGVAAPSQRDVWLSLCPDPNLILHIPEGRLGDRGHHPAPLVEERRRRLGPSLSLAYRTPLVIVRGRGVILYDETGRAFLDAVNNVAHVGHCHPRVVAAGRRQMAVLNTNTRYLHDQILRYAGRLAARLPEPLGVCLFVCSGSEANELALRMARAHTKGRDVFVVDGAYHGNTAALIEASPYKFDGPGGQGAPQHVHKLPMPDDYRGRYRRDSADRGERFAAHLGEEAEKALSQGGRPAAFLCESLLSCGGQIELPPGYLQAAYRHARASGAVCIADEVQVGFGRVGSHFWGFETQAVVPDIVTMGKPIGNGHPLAAVVTTPEIAASFANGMEYFNTFGGNPVSCAIGLAVLDVIRDEGLQERALRVGSHLKAGLAGLRDRHPVVGDVRGLGLFLGIELVLDRETLEPAAAEASYVVERMKDRGILVSTDGPLHNVVKMKPPLVFSEADADRVVAAFDEVLAEDFVIARLAVRG